MCLPLETDGRVIGRAVPSTHATCLVDQRAKMFDDVIPCFVLVVPGCDGPSLLGNVLPYVAFQFHSPILAREFKKPEYREQFLKQYGISAREARDWQVDTLLLEAAFRSFHEFLSIRNYTCEVHGNRAMVEYIGIGRWGIGSLIQIDGRWAPQ